MRRAAFLTTLALAGFLAAFLVGAGDPTGGSMRSRPAERRRHVAPSTAAAPPDTAPPGMAWVPGGEFPMGSDDPQAAPAERPAHRVRVDGFWMDVTEVTNAQFRKFVEATGYLPRRSGPSTGSSSGRSCRPAPRGPRTTGSPPDRSSSRRPIIRSRSTIRPPGGDGSPAQAGGIPRGRAARSRAGTTTRSSTSRGTTPSPTRNGPASDSRPRPSGSSPPGAGWKAAEYAWGDQFQPGDRPLANTWQGHFPELNTAADGFPRTAPVRSFPPNGLRALRHDRQRLGVVRRLVQARCLSLDAPRGGRREPDRPALQLRPRRALPAQAGFAGRLIPVQPELLLELPARRPPRDRHRLGHVAPRVPLRDLAAKGELKLAFSTRPARSRVRVGDRPMS